MNFEDVILPLTEFLGDNSFSVTRKEQNFIEYSTNSAVISVAYSNLEHIFFTHVGQDSESLIELTPIVVKEIFGQDSFQFQSTLTIDNLLSFLNGAGKAIVFGDKSIFKKLVDFKNRKSSKFAKQMKQHLNIINADKAWIQKDYLLFVKSIDMTEKDLLPESYLKKYKIAMDRLNRRSD